MKDLTTAYAEIIKADRNPDGTMTVYGKATDDSIDIDQQICDADWLGRAMPDWFKTGGNIREQHSSIAAGVATDYEAKADGHYISALVVDPISVKKVDSGVLKGFSIGIKNPRVVRDTKAANGRIIDGQIVEVSLVDRPANPNCQLLLAKSVNGEAGVWKVEELIEGKSLGLALQLRETQDAQQRKEILMKSAQEVINLSKTFVKGEVVKFDQKLYDTARQALAQLIAVEANEMVEENSSEEFSIAQLLEAVHHLFAWYEGEEAEGETGEQTETGEGIEMSATTEEKAADKECACKCAKCAEAKGCDSKECSCKVEKSDETEKSAEAETPAEETPAEEAPAEETPAETVAEETKENSEEAPASPESVEALVEKAVKSALEAFKPEIEALKSAKEAAESETVSLKSELATALSKAVAGGPRRTIKPVDSSTNDLLVKAATYKAKAQATTDPDLAKGYTALYEQFIAKADEAQASN